jgi:hypothetical protein
MAIQSRRRWFQFGLRTMFLAVTVLAVWLGWELKFVRERQAWVHLKQQRFTFIETESEWQGPRPASASIPFWRRLLGDEAVIVIHLRSDTVQDKAEWEQAKRLFPEAQIVEAVNGFSAF